MNRKYMLQMYDTLMYRGAEVHKQPCWFHKEIMYQNSQEHNIWLEFAFPRYFNDFYECHRVTINYCEKVLKAKIKN